MGVMIYDDGIIADLTELAARRRTTKAAALKHALSALVDTSSESEPPLFPRSRVTSKTMMIGTPPKSVGR